jgi:hypothetical protein
MLPVEELEVSKIGPIRVWDSAGGGGTWILPSLSHTEIIPTFWIILHQIVSDWTDAAGQYALSAQASSTVDKATFLFDTFELLKPRFIQCLFAYINFFFTLEKGFEVFYDELKRINYELGLKIKPEKKPTWPAYVKKMRRVRHYTVVHWGDPKGNHELDSRAGRNWGFSYPGDADSLIEMTFGNESLEGAADRVLSPLSETHQICASYIKQYDRICADLLARIIAHLPMTVGSRQYVYTGSK